MPDPLTLPPPPDPATQAAAPLTAQPAEETAPQRRRGGRRPKLQRVEVGADGSVNPTLETQPKRRGRPPGRRNKVAERNTVYTNVATSLGLGNALFVLARPELRDDALNEQELGALSKAVGDEILTSERLTALILRASETGVHVRLAYTLAMIAIPRMVRHGKLPAEVGHAIAFANAAAAADAARERGGEPSPSDPPVPMAQRGTPEPERGHRVGEIDPSGSVVDDASVRRHLPNQG